MAVLWSAAAAFGGNAPLEAGVGAFLAAQQVWDGPGMDAGRAQLAAAAAQPPADYTALYWQGVSEFYLMLYYGLDESEGRDPVRAQAVNEAAERTLKAAIEANDNDAECRAMLSCVYGFRIAEHPWKAVWLGPRVLALQGAALRRGEDNPRVHYLIGAGYQGAPDIFRNTGKARAHLERAEELFRSQRAAARGPLEPRWGEAETLGLLGDILNGTGDTAAARRYYRAALEVNPHYTPASRKLAETEGNDGT